MSKTRILFCLLNKQNRIVVLLINSHKHIAFLDDLVLKNLLHFEVLVVVAAVVIRQGFLWRWHKRSKGYHSLFQVFKLGGRRKRCMNRKNSERGGAVGQ